MKLKLPSLATLALASCLGCCLLAADAQSPLPPWYPPLKDVPGYDPARFTPPAQAVIDLPSGAFKEADFNETRSLNGTWKFSGLERSTKPFPSDASLDKGYEKPDFDDAKWDSIPVPQSFYVKYKHEPARPYVMGWYRRSVEIPASASGKRVLLHFDVIGYEALLFVDGKRIGSHHGDFTPWTVDISDAVKPGKPALIAIRVFSDLGPSGACLANEIIKLSKHPYGSQYAPSNIKGGLWRSAEMRVEPALRISKAFVDTNLKNSSIDVRCRVVNDGKSKRRLTLYGNVKDALAKALSTSPAPSAPLAKIEVEPGVKEIAFSIPLKNPKLWSPDSPNLYNLVLSLNDGSKPVAVKGERFGYRSFKIENGHFLLNGKRIYLFGESLEVAGYFENGKPEIDQPDVSEKARVRSAKFLTDIKAGGANTLRLSEQPVASVFLEQADEIGVMIYDMWAWSYNYKLDPSFEKTDFAELEEWVERDYNHPSVVMWLGGNEVKCDKDVAGIFSRQSDLLRSLEKGGRPVSVFSGAAAGYAGDIKLNTDMLDLHNYTGLGDGWSSWENKFDKQYGKALSIYSKDGKSLGMPYVIWELVGFSWGAKYAKYEPGDVDAYLKWAKGPTSWANPNGIGWAGSIGLDAALDKKRGALYAMASIGRRIMGMVRQDTRVDGFAPWFTKYSPDLAARTLWMQPVYCGIRGESSAVPPRNVFAGRTLSVEAFAVNSANEDYKDATLKFSLAEADGSEKALAEWRCGDLKAWSKLSKRIEIRIPDAKGARWTQLRQRLVSKDGKLLSMNFDDLFIASEAEACAPVEMKKSAGVLSCGASGESALTEILDALKFKYVKVSKPGDFEKLEVLVIPPTEKPIVGMGAGSALPGAINAWIKKGGTLLVLEQNASGAFPVSRKAVRSIPALLADLVIPAHPAFAGLSQANFEFWGGDPLGLTAKYATMPVGRDLIAARAPYCAELQTFSLLSDGRLGQGRLIGSQFDACARWRVDSAATLYLRNLLASLMNQPPKELKDFDESGADFSSSKRAEFAFVDLKPKANMGFKDEVAGDGKGGWTDQGDNDFRTMPLGRQTLRGIPFEIVDPATNGGKSCLVVKDNPKGDFKSSIEGVAIGRKFSRLFFLHGEAFVSSGKTLKYTLHYEDGSSVEIPTAENVSIADWWSAGDLSGARLGINRKNKVDRDVGLLIMDWENPHPEKTIASLDLTAPEGKDAISMLVALTGELPSGRRIEVGGPNWARIADAGNGNILKTGALIPSVSPIPSLGPDAIAVKMPGRSDADPKPVVFRRFLKSEEAKALPGNFNYLVFEIKGLAPGEIQLMLPDENFKNNFKYSLAVDKDAEFHTVRIPLDAFEAPAKNARGEFYVFNTGKTPCEFQLKNLRIE